MPTSSYHAKSQPNTQSAIPSAQVFVKYNAVLRGLRSDVLFLRNSMVSLCCSKEVVAKFKANEISIEVAVTSVNRYPNTLHAINSAVVKASKLSKARKIYRGIAGMALPKEFWEPNEYGEEHPAPTPQHATARHTSSLGTQRCAHASLPLLTCQE